MHLGYSRELCEASAAAFGQKVRHISWQLLCLSQASASDATDTIHSALCSFQCLYHPLPKSPPPAHYM